VTSARSPSTPAYRDRLGDRLHLIEASIGLASVSSDVDPETLASAMSDAGFEASDRFEHPLPNGKILVRQDFRVTHSG
jgi:hypothetical protein